MKFQVDRKIWGRGGNFGPGKEHAKGSYLLDKETGFMCCLGFRAKACGFEAKQFVDVAMPHDIKDSQEKVLETFKGLVKTLISNGEKFITYTTECAEIASINDRVFNLGPQDWQTRSPIDGATREAILIEKFALLGDEVEFIN